MSVKKIFVVAAAVLGSVGLISAQGYNDDDIYYNPDKEVKKKPEPVVVKTQTVTVIDYPAADTYGVHTTGAVRDVDEYNRRMPVESDSTLKTQGETFEYTRRIERFYDPQVVVSLDDPELVEYYYASAQPEVNIIVGSTSFTDPWLWNFGWYSPYSYSYWGWNSWYCGYPYSWWRPSWYYGWYTPGWYHGWHPHPSHHHGYYPGGGNRRWANSSPGGWRTQGYRNGHSNRDNGYNRYNGGRGGIGYKPGSSPSRPNNNHGYSSGNRRGQGGGAIHNNTNNNHNSRNSYNSGRSHSERRSGFSSGGMGGGNRGGFGGGGHRGGGGGRGGRR